MSESLTLKWGTLKAWDLDKEGPAFAALKRYGELGMSASAMMQRRTPEHIEVLCELIDALDADTVYLDWDDKHVSKDEAKKYVVEYGQKEATS